MSKERLKAPLVEVIFEIRWGERTQLPNGDTQVKFSNEEQTFLAGELKANLKPKFPEYEPLHTEMPVDMGIPHFLKHRFWAKKGAWPCVQLGLGLMTVNHANDADDYNWAQFADNCKFALECLSEAFSVGLEGLQHIGVDLRYRDGFVLRENESDSDFIKDRALIDFGMPDAFLNSDLISGTPESHNITFNLPTNKPKGILINKLGRAEISGRPGFLQETVVRSAGPLCPEFNLDSLIEWLDSAHILQQHTFDTLIKATNERGA